MILEARNLRKTFHRGRLKAVDGVSFGLSKGRTLGIVGESGSGKTTLMKLVLRLLEADGGEIYFEGKDVSAAKEKDLKDFRKKVQLVFQHPYLSLDPGMTVTDILKEPFWIHREKDRALVRRKIRELLEAVELPESFLGRYPHELSGGECQRVAIARALSTGPEVLVCDEPVSALDLLVQAQILNLLLKLQKERRVSYLFVSHDLRVVRHMSDDVLVMKDGVACEYGPCDGIFKNPRHPYTRSLLESAFF